MNKLLLTLSILFYTGYAVTAQEANPTLILVLKHQLKELKENLPASQEDHVIQSASPFIPPHGKYDGESLPEKYFDSIKNNIQVHTGGASLYETDDGELRIDYLQVNTDWVNIPCWQDVHIVPFFSSVTGSGGQEFILPQNKYEEYAEQGYFQQDYMGGASYGNHEMKVYLGEEPVREDYPLKMKGELWFSFPTEYQSYTFSISDTGKTVPMDKYKITLLAMDRNTVTYRVVGPRQFSDEYRKLCTNKDGKPFVSREGSSLSYEFYTEAKKNNYELSDKRLNELAVKIEKEAYAGGTIDHLFIEKVPGTFSKITFYKVISMGEKSLPMEIEVRE